MTKRNLYVITEPNAAGKSSFIRSRLSNFEDFVIIMTDVYQERTKEVFYTALQNHKNIVFETVFNNSSFGKFVEDTKKAGYHIKLIVLFLNSPDQSLKRVAIRYLEQSGLDITRANVDMNFHENFKNITLYH